MANYCPTPRRFCQGNYRGGTAGDQEVAKWREVEGKWDSPVGFFVEKRASTEEGKKVAIGCMNASKTDSEAGMYQLSSG